MAQQNETPRQQRHRHTQPRLIKAAALPGVRPDQPQPGGQRKSRRPVRQHHAQTVKTAKEGLQAGVLTGVRQPASPGGQADPVAQSVDQQALIAAHERRQHGQRRQREPGGIDRRGKSGSPLQTHGQRQVKHRQQRPAQAKLRQRKLTGRHACRDRDQREKAGRKKPPWTPPQPRRQRRCRRQDGVGDCGRIEGGGGVEKRPHGSDEGQQRAQL